MSKQKTARQKKQRTNKPRQNRKPQIQKGGKQKKKIKINSVSDVVAIARFVYEVIRDIFLS